MPISELHIVPRVTGPAPFPTTSYEYLRDQEIKISENDPLRVNGNPLGIHLDLKGRVAIGYGYDLLQRPASNSAATLTPYLAAGVTITPTQIEILEARRLNRRVNLPGHPLHGFIPTATQVIAEWANVTLASEARASDLLTVVVNQFDSSLDAHLGFVLPASKERAALVSMAYNGGLGLIGAALRGALLNDDRAEAWFQIRYNSNGGASQSPGIANRRYRESELFGLHDDGALTPVQLEQQAKEVLRMYTFHRDHIRWEERWYLPGSGTSGIDQHPEVASDKALLIAKFVTNENLIVNKPNIVGEVLVGSDRSLDPKITGTVESDLVMGEGGVDELEGKGGNDVIYGGDGDDFLDGGAGEDYLIGGAGSDTYLWRTGDGNDRIIDEDRRGRIMINDQDRGDLFAGGYFNKVDGQNVWKSPDGLITLTHNSPFKLVTSDGAEIDLGETLNDGDFGIQLEERVSVPTTVWAGDQNPNQLDDVLSTGSTVGFTGYHLLAGAGSDVVKLVGPEIDVIEGGAGADILVASNGDDEVFGGTRVDLASFIAESQTASGTGLRGDWVSGGLGEDVLVGSHANDVLMGGGGEDLLVGGAGEDVIDGDDNFLPSTNPVVGDGGEFPERFLWFSGGPAFNWSVDRTDRFNPVFTPVAAVSSAREVGASDTVYAGAGDDIVAGMFGDDVLYGEDGADVMTGDDGSDTLLGGDGRRSTSC